MICEELDGPVYEPASGNPPRQLVVLLHGYGDTGDGLIDLAPALARFMPDARFVAPHAPEPFELAFFGRQWFSLEDLDDMSAIEAGAERARPVLDAFLDEELAVAGLPESRLAILGFSQGAMMALYTAFRRSRPCAAVVGFSGLLVAPDTLADALTVRVPTLLVHGRLDDVVPFSSMHVSKVALAAAGVPVHSVTRPDLDHGIDQEGLASAGRFLRDYLTV